MADNSATLPQNPSQAHGATFAEQKGKGKAPAEHMTEDTAMDEDDDDDSDDDEEEVAQAEDDDDDDGMDEIDPNNIVQGRRTRGAQIDFAKAAAENPAEDEDEEDDEDFQPANENEDTKMSD
ncbi:Histone H2A.Z-specific chaperone chz1 [Fusarium austroafricanum]|uniref:Histone H2A.Z-specific chaperone chz1 n=1 Tax=Fusarium austroafricanum TaxID=2364996 RepID=A0A8H4NV36_9HYPO|nr:Histone H2A.Z-specific chaperone chz1 [Fusarium austroafricanum]